MHKCPAFLVVAKQSKIEEESHEQSGIITPSILSFCQQNFLSNLAKEKVVCGLPVEGPTWGTAALSIGLEEHVL